jgi:alkyl sulfatase BDS1-like metallo-beta-lactamase superfamily hydrolase
LTLWGKDVETLFASHHWPTWGNQNINKLIKSQRDLYKYINDQTLHLANQGYTMLEIGEMMKLPPELDKVWANRNYYGTMNHNVKAVYQRYLGWFDGNPSTLHQLPPEDAGKKYVEALGGTEAALSKAKSSFDAGDYRWAAQLLNHVVFAEPKNDKARFLLADALEQLGYQAESGPWRGFYLTGAMELRQGVRNLPAPDTASKDVVAGMTPEMFLDYLAVRLDPAKTAGKKFSMALVITGGKQKQQEYTVVVEISVLNHTAGKSAEPVDVTLTVDQPTFVAINGGKLTLPDAVKENKAKVAGDQNKLAEFAGFFDTFEFWFPIVTP